MQRKNRPMNYQLKNVSGNPLSQNVYANLWQQQLKKYIGKITRYPKQKLLLLMTKSCTLQTIENYKYNKGSRNYFPFQSTWVFIRFSWGSFCPKLNACVELLWKFVTVLSAFLRPMDFITLLLSFISVQPTLVLYWQPVIWLYDKTSADNENGLDISHEDILNTTTFIFDININKR